MGNMEFILLRTRSGKRWVRISSIEQFLHDPGQLGGPWFIRSSSQQIPVTPEEAAHIAQILQLSTA